MGFDFVSPKPISYSVLMEQLLKDFYNKGIKKRRVNHLIAEKHLRIASAEFIDDNPMTDEVFIAEREREIRTIMEKILQRMSRERTTKKHTGKGVISCLKTIF